MYIDIKLRIKKSEAPEQVTRILIQQYINLYEKIAAKKVQYWLTKSSCNAMSGTALSMS